MPATSFNYAKKVNCSQPIPFQITSMSVHITAAYLAPKLALSATCGLTLAKYDVILIFVYEGGTTRGFEQMPNHQFTSYKLFCSIKGYHSNTVTQIDRQIDRQVDRSIKDRQIARWFLKLLRSLTAELCEFYNGTIIRTYNNMVNDQ